MKVFGYIEQCMIVIHAMSFIMIISDNLSCESCDDYFFVYFFGGLECVGPSFSYVAHFVFLRDVWIRTQRAALASRRATNLATHLSNDSCLSRYC
jgi:hypothetical protein